jgi:hypothetical protein
MPAQAFRSESELSPESLEYLFEQAEELSEKDDLAIENYADSEINNPEVEEVLLGDEFAALEDEDVEDEDFVLTPPQRRTFKQRRALRRERRRSAERRFKGFRKKVHQAFCTVAATIIDAGVVDWKAVLRTVLVGGLALIGVAFPVALIPATLAVLAMFLKRGYEALCPA